MDWMECDGVEAIPGKMGGRPVIKGTRIEPALILTEEERSRTAIETHEDFPTLSIETILKIRAFTYTRQLVP
jgi:uncharacterized protein (DUF433 family)